MPEALGKADVNAFACLEDKGSLNGAIFFSRDGNKRVRSGILNAGRTADKAREKADM